MGIISVLGGLVKFCFSLRREERPALHPPAKVLTDFLGLGQLGIGIWGMVLVFPNIGILSNPGPETCEVAPMVCMLLPTVIISLVIVIMIGFGIHLLVGRKNGDDKRKVQE